jgi:uncharacterized Zn finger protein (UPF0148 family)
MAHIMGDRPARPIRPSKQAARRLHQWVALHARVCERCGLPLVGRSYTNAVLQQVCGDCLLVEASSQADGAAEMPQITQEG